MENIYTLKLTAAVVIDGDIVRAGELVELSKAEAQNLLGRGKAELVTDASTVFDAPEAQDLSRMNKAQLQEFANGLQIEFNDADTKAQLIAAIEAKQAEGETDPA